MHQFTYNGRNVYNDTQEFIRVDQALRSEAQCVFYRYLHDSIPDAGTVSVMAAARLAFPGVQNSQTTSPATQQLGARDLRGQVLSLLVDGGYAYSFGAILSRPVGLGTLAGSPDIKPNASLCGHAGCDPEPYLHQPDGHQRRRQLQRLQPQSQRVRQRNEGDRQPHGDCGLRASTATRRRRMRRVAITARSPSRLQR